MHLLALLFCFFFQQQQSKLPNNDNVQVHNNVRYQGRGFVESDSDSDSDNMMDRNDDDEEVESFDSILLFLQKLVKSLGDRLVLGFNSTVIKTGSALTDGAKNVYYAFQDEFVKKQEEIRGASIIQDKRHCNNHELHLMKDEDGKDLKTIIDTIIDLIDDLRQHFKKQIPLNILIKYIFKLELKMLTFDSEFKARWISHAKTEYKKFERMMPAIFLTLIEEVDTLLSNTIL